MKQVNSVDITLRLYAIYIINDASIILHSVYT